MRRLLFTVLMFLAAIDRASAQGPLDLLPKDAALAISIRNLDELIKRGDKFLTQTEIKVPIRPSELFKAANQFLGITQGLNTKSSAAIILMQPENLKKALNGEDVEILVVPVIPFTDVDSMASNFGIAKGKLMPKIATRIPKNLFPNIARFATPTQSHLYLSGSEKTLERLAKSKPLAETFTPAQRKPFNDSDILIHFGRYLWTMEQNTLTRRLAQKIKAGPDPKEQEFAKQFAASVNELQDAVLGFRLDDGIDGHLLATVPKDGQAAKMLKAMREKRKPTTIKGLPEGNVLLAQASSGDNGQQALLAKVFFQFMLETFLMQQDIVPQVDLLNYLGIVHEVWRQLEGNRFAVYQNVDEKKLGLFSAVAILDTENAAQFLREMRTLTKMATADSLDWTKVEVKDEIDLGRIVRDLDSSVYRVRMSASTKLNLIGEPALPYLEKAIVSKDNDLEGKRRARELRDLISVRAAERRKELLSDKNRPLFARPKLTFVANVEIRQGVSIDVIDIKIAGLEKVPAHQFTQLLGPDWDKLRLAVVGNQIVVMLGSDLALFDAALENVLKGGAGLAASKRLNAFHERSSKERLFEFHVSVEGIMRLVTAKVDRDRPVQFTSVALTLGEQSLQVHARVPIPEVRAIARKAQEELR